MIMRGGNARARSVTFFIAAVLCAQGVGAYGESAKSVYTETIEEIRPFNPGGTLTLNGKNGGVEIDVWDEDQIKIVGEKRLRIDKFGSFFARLIGLKTSSVKSDEEAKALFAQFGMEVTGDAEDLTVQTLRPKDASNMDFRMDYIVLVPRRADVTIEITNGSIEVRGVTGRVDTTTTNGHIDLADIAGAINVRSTNGSLDLQDVLGSIEARTVNGRIEVEVTGFTDTEDGISCRTTNGSISLGMPRDGHFNIHVESRPNRFESDFEVISIGQEDPGELEGSVGDGGPLVSLKTTNGRIELEAI